MIGILAFTDRGTELAKRISKGFPDEQCIFYDKGNSTARQFVDENFKKVDKLIFVGALGITVRLISAHIVKKDEDPAVICVDEMGKHVISVLSGHIGGGNELAEHIANFIGADPVITTATDLSKVWACDVWAVKNNCRVFDTSEIKAISGALLRGEKVGFKSVLDVEGDAPNGICLVKENSSAEGKSFKNGIFVGYDEAEKPFEHTLNLIPRNIVLGVGCRRNTNPNVFEDFILENLKHYNISIKAVSQMASIDLKKDEECINSFSEKHGINCRFFSAAELMAVPGKFHHSDFVEKTTGADNVCERSAAGIGANNFILEKKSKDGMTIAIGVKDWKGKF